MATSGSAASATPSEAARCTAGNCPRSGDNECDQCTQKFCEGHCYHDCAKKPMNNADLVKLVSTTLCKSMGGTVDRVSVAHDGEAHTTFAVFDDEDGTTGPPTKKTKVCVKDESGADAIISIPERQLIEILLHENAQKVAKMERELAAKAKPELPTHGCVDVLPPAAAAAPAPKP